ncbi:Transposon Ty3-G Gag-Pol poly [Paramuricea clavata]|uniref:Transposon Ty3-G Gag-Pol poly n=1 Tax=Paramuricea clavata TaxID=317549 RepID=A0A6S7HY44_PARCT|nr:Transposon Ty3-G Gag-Pol poly [Paramuricea clavata]
MRVTLTPEKTVNLKLCLHTLKHPKLTIRELAHLIGILVSSFPGVQYGPLHYWSLEMLKSEALKSSKGNFEALVSINNECVEDLQWWVDNIERPKADITIHTDASKMGWGAVVNKTAIGGRWTSLESQEHINSLELKALFMGLKSFYRNLQHKHVQAFMDNTTAVAYVNSMGGTKSTQVNKPCKGSLELVH